MTTQRTSAEKIIRELGLLNKPGFPTFDQFVHEWLPREVLQSFFALDGGKQGPASSAMIQMLYPVLIALKAGNPVFQIKPDLITSLRDTDIPELSIELLKTPFEALRVDVPKNTFAAPAENVQEIYISHIDEDRFRVVFTQGEYSHYVSVSTTNPEQIIKAAIERTMEETLKNTPTELWRQIKEESIYEDYFKADVFRFAVNLMLYVTCSDADMYQDKTKQHEFHRKLQGLKGTQRRATLLRKLAQEKEQKIFIVGANVRLSKEYNAELTESGKKWTLDHKVRVSGHFKNQPCGSRALQRKLIWVAPYFKGPSYAEMIEKKYVVA